MPKIIPLGDQYFAQYMRFPVQWKNKLLVRGWTQEIEEPFRTANPVIFRLPFYRALVLGKWNGQLTEEEALSRAIERRDLTDDDFSEENGWVPAPDQDPEEDL
jgi:hypothetical protein